jgi:hypothetical protein
MGSMRTYTAFMTTARPTIRPDDWLLSCAYGSFQQINTSVSRVSRPE